MASSELDLDVIENWLHDGAYCLELWLACGMATPTPQAVAALQTWSAAIETAGFKQMLEQTQMLLSKQTSITKKADALLNLMVWQQSLQRTYTARQMVLHYDGG